MHFPTERHDKFLTSMPNLAIRIEGNTLGTNTLAGTLPTRPGSCRGSHSFSVLDAAFDERSRLTTALARFFGAERPGPTETIALMDQFRPYRSLACYHLWQSLHSEDV